MLGLTRQECHKTVSVLLLPSLTFVIPRFVSNRAYLGSFGAASWASHEFERTRGKCFVNYDGPPSRILKNFFRESIENYNLDATVRRALNDFYHDEKKVYKGYIDDARNTDNAWIESNAVNFHDLSGWNTHELKLQSKDSQQCKWMDIHEKENVYPPHLFILERLSKVHCLHENIFDSD
ncbi:ADP-ribose pyrophosphatase, mitochondrial [Trichonephila clavipes]|nr:ADP-ribose pyrophosphatase, mitochondrial [Trichonephila clavipes]